MPTDKQALKKRKKREAKYQQSLQDYRIRLEEKDRKEDARRPGGDPSKPRPRS